MTRPYSVASATKVSKPQGQSSNSQTAARSAAPNITMNPTVTSLRSARRVILGVETPAVPGTNTSHKETAMTQPIGDPARDERELT
jgi:hypothetical protein